MIFPAIDMRGGQSVRLYKGDFAKETVIEASPLVQAKKIEASRAGALHLVDLDGAKKGFPQHMAIVKDIRQAFTGCLEIGGGIRTEETIKVYIEAGVDRLILGSIAVTDTAFTKRMLSIYGGDRIVIGVDGKNGRVATEGWLKESDMAMDVLIGQMIEAGAKSFIVTDIDTDGTMAGPNISLLAGLQKQFPKAQIVASGGIRTLADIKALQAEGVKNAIIGRALFDGTITLEEIAKVNAQC